MIVAGLALVCSTRDAPAIPHRMKRCNYCGARYSDEVVACGNDGHPLYSLDESQERSRTSDAPRVRCPACGAADDYTSTVALRSSFSWIVFFAGGLPAVLFRNAGRRTRVRCNQCKGLFNVRTRASKLSLILFWAVICPTIIGLIVFLIVLFHTVFS
jgi:hypothetical protein